MARYPTLTAGAIAAVIVAATTSFIFARAQPGIAESALPLPVPVTTFKTQSSYIRNSNFIGIIRAANDSALGFEVAGTINRVNVREGDSVAVGDVIAELDTDRLQARRNVAQAELARISAELELAQLRAKRTADLVNKGLASNDANDEARYGAQALAAAKDALKAQLASVELEISKSVLHAPFTGIVAERMAQQGTVVNPGAPVLRLILSTGREAHVGLPIDQSRLLQIGDHYTLRLGEQAFSAQLSAIRGDVDPTTLTIGAVFDLPDDVVANAGETVLLSLAQTYESRGGWLPLSALTEGNRGLWNVLAITAGERGFSTRRESVEVVETNGTRVFVRGTLVDGDQIVASGVHKLSSGLLVEPVAWQGTNTLREGH